MKLAFIFTNYNNSSFTEAAIESIGRIPNNDAVIIIVDNASKSESVAHLKRIDSKGNNVKVIYNDENVGYFHGLNIGIDYACANYPEVLYYVVGNNDLVFPENFISSVYENSELFEKYPVVSPDIVTLDGFHQNPHVIKGISKKREFVYDVYYSNYYLAGLIKKVASLFKSFTDRKDEEQFEVAQEIYQGYGACYILGPKFFSLFENLWMPTFMMYEEYFLSNQLEGKGYKVYYEPSINVQHHWHATMDTLPGKQRWLMAKTAHKKYREFVKVFS
jgi:GT2 family glycosyltransferase